jgi:hypothetical protein
MWARRPQMLDKAMVGTDLFESIRQHGQTLII